MGGSIAVWAPEWISPEILEILKILDFHGDPGDPEVDPWADGCMDGCLHEERVAIGTAIHARSDQTREIRATGIAMHCGYQQRTRACRSKFLQNDIRRSPGARGPF